MYGDEIFISVDFVCTEMRLYVHSFEVISSTVQTCVFINLCFLLDTLLHIDPTHPPQESELLSLAKSVGGERAEVESLNSQMLELTQRHQTQEQERHTLVSEIKGGWGACSE